MMIIDDIQPGRSFRIYYGKGHRGNRLLHIRAIVDDVIVVYREWSRRKQRWIYSAEPVSFFEVADSMGYLRKR